jgi:hypothetical protein
MLERDHPFRPVGRSLGGPVIDTAGPEPQVLKVALQHLWSL